MGGRKLLTFLGTGDYKRLTYRWGEHAYTTCYAPAASASFLKPREILVFATEKAADLHLENLRAEAPRSVKVLEVSVPAGRDEGELWEIFQRLTGSVEPGEQVAFDVTHGFRSLPMLGLLAAAFLRSGLEVALQAVLYGAYEARRERGGRLEAPMFDLSPMLSLLEWSAAAERFKRSGDAGPLGELLKAHRKSLATGGLPDGRDLAGKLGNLANHLQRLSDALRLVRPQEAAASAARLPASLQAARPALEALPHLRPFALMLEGLGEAYAPLAARRDRDPWETLRAQRRALRWYMEREQWMQAAALAREWLVSWTMAWSGSRHLCAREERERAERGLGAWLKIRREAGAEEPAEPLPVPERESVLKLWDGLLQARNDLLHAGMREDPVPADRLISRLKNIEQGLRGLPLQGDSGSPQVGP